MAAKKAAALTAAGLVLLAGVGGVVIVAGSIGSGGGGGRGTRTVALAPANATSGVNAAASAASDSASPAVTFGDGTIVRLVAMNELPSPSAGAWVRDVLGFGGNAGAAANPQPTLWWGADGSEVPAISMRDLGSVSAGTQQGRRQVGFIFAMPVGANSANANLSVRVSDVTSHAMTSRRLSGERLTHYVGSINQDVERVQIRLGYASGPWREDASMPVAGAGAGAGDNAGDDAGAGVNAGAAGATSGPATRPAGPAVFGKVGVKDGRCTVEIIHGNIPGGSSRDGRMVAVLTDGREVGMHDYYGRGDGTGVASFECRPEQVGKFVYLSRPFEWGTLSDVAVKPKAPPATGSTGDGRGVAGK
jgi:hypothetical protein